MTIIAHIYYWIVMKADIQLARSFSNIIWDTDRRRAG